MPVLIIDTLELVDIAQQQSVPAFAQATRNPFLEATAVENTRQMVNVALVPQIVDDISDRGGENGHSEACA